MTKTMAREFLRLIDKLPETDPTSTAYHVLLQSIECLNSIGQTIEEMLAESNAVLDGPVSAHVDWAEGQEGKIVELTASIDPDKVPVHPIPTAPFETADFPETPEEQEGHEVAELVKQIAEQPEPPKEEKTYQSSDVRAALVDARGRGVNVGEILQRFGVSNFQFLPATQYGALIEALKAV